MRKITQETLNAWNNGNSFSKSNTCVTKEGAVFLHGNQIIKVVKGLGVFASDGGYGWSPTTAERLKPWCRFKKVKGQPFIDDIPYISGNWVAVELYSFPELHKTEAPYGC
tara:strand:- start:852 stop:1181 length:330 start_codon:yes stop_codon:yes gene_type:complete